MKNCIVRQKLLYVFAIERWVNINKLVFSEILGKINSSLSQNDILQTEFKHEYTKDKACVILLIIIYV